MDLVYTWRAVRVSYSFYLDSRIDSLEWGWICGGAGCPTREPVVEESQSILKKKDPPPEGEGPNPSIQLSTVAAGVRRLSQETHHNDCS